MELPPLSTLIVEARIAPEPWSQARSFPVANGARSTTLTSLTVQSPYDVRFVILESNGNRLESAATAADTAPVGCGGEKKNNSACAVV